MRIDTLEYAPCTYIGTPPEHIDYEIRRIVPNTYYGRESEFIKDGDYYKPKEYSWCRIHKDCFKNPETKYTIGTWRYDEHEEWYEFQFCGDRPIDLTDSEWINFKHILKYGYRQLNPERYEE